MGEFSLVSGIGLLGITREEIALVNEAKGFKLVYNWLLWGNCSEVDMFNLGKL